MSNRLFRLNLGCAVTALVCSGLMLGLKQTAQAQGGRPIEFSEPKNSELTTNLHQLTTKKDTLKQLEENLSKSLRPFSPGSALEDEYLPLPRPSTGSSISSKRARELMERRKNYMFMTPEDLMKGPSTEEVFKLPEYTTDGQDKKKLTPLEQYYQRQDPKYNATRKPRDSSDESLSGSISKANPREGTSPLEETTLPESLRNTEQALKQLFGTAASTENGTAPALKRNPYSDIFGLGEVTPSPVDAQKHKRFIESLSSFSDPISKSTPGLDGLSALGGGLGIAPRPLQPSAPAVDLPATKPREGLDTQLGTINPILSPIGPQDVNAQLFGQTAVAPSAPKTEAPRSPIATPTFTSPRRPF
jgi:hypothetical protein